MVFTCCARDALCTPRSLSEEEFVVEEEEEELDEEDEVGTLGIALSTVSDFRVV